jgi:hypothetical protein
LAYNRDNNPPVSPYPGDQFGGSGSQIAAFALGAIDRFASSAGRTANPKPRAGLSFANSGNPVLLGWGGGWDGINVSCAQDYFASAALVTSSIDPGNGPWNIAGATSGAYTHSGPLTIAASGIINNGKKITVYVDGDVAITQDINFNNAGGPANPRYNNGIADIPSVRIIARGNILIAPTVTRIDGVLVAQPRADGSGGVLTTCSDGGFGLPNATQIDDATNGCRRFPLRVYGAVIAKQVLLLRSSGSLRDALNNERHDNGAAAERFIYTPEVWLAQPQVRPPVVEPYEAFTTLPPIL